MSTQAASHEVLGGAVRSTSYRNSTLCLSQALVVYFGLPYRLFKTRFSSSCYGLCWAGPISDIARLTNQTCEKLNSNFKSVEVGVKGHRSPSRLSL